MSRVGLTCDLANGGLDAVGDTLPAGLRVNISDAVHQSSDVERLEFTSLDGMVASL